MDTELRNALRDLQENFTEETHQRYGVMLMRSGLSAVEALNELLLITSNGIKAIILKELAGVELLETEFITKDPSLAIMEDYRGHAIKIKAHRLGEGCGSRYGSVAYLTSGGIFEYTLDGTRLFLAGNGKISSFSERREYPVLTSQEEVPEVYLKYGRRALREIAQRKEK